MVISYLGAHIRVTMEFHSRRRDYVGKYHILTTLNNASILREDG